MSISEQNRNANYNEIRSELNARQLLVLDLLLANPQGLTRDEIAQRLNLPINSITGRVFELEERELIETTKEKRLSRYGKPGTVVKAIIKQQPVKLEQTYFW